MKNRPVIPYAKQWIDQADIDAVNRVLTSSRITQGPVIDQFEEAIAQYTGTHYAIAFCNGTAALHGAMHAAGLNSQDQFITSTLSFVASANCGLYKGAEPILRDIASETYCMNTENLPAEAKVIIPIDFGGFPCPLEDLLNDRNKKKTVIIEDAAHALGAVRNHQIVGKQADMTMFSFHPVKHITTAEGGIIVTDSAEYAESLREFRSHGITRDRQKCQKYDGPWYYEMHDLGYNYRITDIQCALGLSQLKKLPGFLQRRRDIAARYDESFRDHPLLTIPPVPANGEHAYHLYPLLLDHRCNRREIFEELKKKGILCQIHYIPIHLQPYYQENFHYQSGDFPSAEDYYKREISIPMYAGLSNDEIHYVIDSILTVLEKK